MLWYYLPLWGAVPGAVKERGGGFTASFVILAASCALVAVLSILFPEPSARLKRRRSGGWAEEQRLRQLKSAEEALAATGPPRGRV